MRKFKLFNRDFSFCNIGIGKFKTSEGLELFKKIVGNTRFISVRDKISLSILKSHFSSSNKWILGGDLACLSEIKEKSKKEEKILIFCGHFQYKNDNNIISKYSEILQNLGNLGFKILFLPMHQGKLSDNLFHEKIAKKLKTPYEIIDYHPAQVFNHLKQGFFVISMRLHGVVLSDLVGIPNIGIAYQEKVSTYIKSTNVLSEIRIKNIGDFISPKEIESIANSYNRPDRFLQREKERAINGMKITQI